MENIPQYEAPVLDSADRLVWNNPAEIVGAVGIPTGARVAEIGCGTGWFTFELEKAVRPRGMVYALDMQPAMLQILETRRQHWERVLTLPCGENTFELDDGEVDVVFHANTLHEVRSPQEHLREVHRVLKHGGRLIVIEWHWMAEESHPGPHNSRRLEPGATKELLAAAGFAITGVQDVGPYHYVVQGVKA
jgi:ubiquinone/menaquinone biosynthesis C-methylase UbiE